MRDSLDDELETPLVPDLFAKKFGYPPAMVRLAIECGLEASDGKITGVVFCQWLTEHYNEVRKAAGLQELATPTEAMSGEEHAHITIGNVLRTHADYFASRTASLAYKEAWMQMSNSIASRPISGTSGSATP
jgi:hypothetical protein